MKSKECSEDILYATILSYRIRCTFVFNIWQTRVREQLKQILAMQAKGTEPTASIYKSDRPKVNIWDIWKIFWYLNIN